MPAANPFPARASRDGLQALSGTCSERDMVRLITGNHMRSVNLVSVPTIGYPLSFSLTYNSQEGLVSPQPVGHKWRHNYMARLLFGGPGLVTYVSESGRHHHFVPDGSGGWQLQTNPVSYFIDAVLSNPSGTLWVLTFKPSNEQLQFEQTPLPGLPATEGRLVSQVDPHGNASLLSYSLSDGLLTAVTEPTGRQLKFSYSGPRLASVEDPRGNVHTFVYDTVNDNLTDIVGPDGCLLSYGYATPTDHLITSRTDALGRTYGYTFNPAAQLLTVTDPESQLLTYTYDTVPEFVAHSAPDTYDFRRTLLLDARGNVWDHRFDKYGNLWRTISPLGHTWRAYYDQQQQGLLYESEGYPAPPFQPSLPDKLGPTDIHTNRFRRYRRDGHGNVLSYADALGRLDEFVRDPDQRVVSATPGRANLGIQGNWYDEFGSDGYLLCSFDSASADVLSLPAYVASVDNGDAGGALPFSRVHRGDLGSHWVDPRVPLGRSGSRKTLKGGIGFWTRSGSDSEFVFRIQVNTPQQFNLSIYSHSADAPPFPFITPWWNYAEQFGRDLELIVDDLDPYTGAPRQQTFRMTNNAAGFWVTFALSATPAVPVQVRVQATGLNVANPAISALAFGC